VTGISLYTDIVVTLYRLLVDNW